MSNTADSVLDLTFRFSFAPDTLLRLPDLAGKKAIVEDSSSRKQSASEPRYATTQQVLKLARTSLESSSSSFSSSSATSATSQNASPVTKRFYQKISPREIAQAAKESLEKEEESSSKVLPPTIFALLQKNGKS